MNIQKPQHGKTSPSQYYGSRYPNWTVWGGSKQGPAPTKIGGTKEGGTDVKKMLVQPSSKYSLHLVRPFFFNLVYPSLTQLPFGILKVYFLSFNRASFRNNYALPALFNVSLFFSKRMGFHPPWPLLIIIRKTKVESPK